MVPAVRPAGVAAQNQAGLYKSTDGGNSCVRLGSGYPAGNVGNAAQFVNQWINVIPVDPADSQTLYLASTSGVFRSTDGGLNWTQGANVANDARSLVLDTSSPAANRILHAGVVGQGVFTSTDGGLNWTQILSATTPVVAAAVGPAPNGIGKVIVDIAPPTTPPNANGMPTRTQGSYSFHFAVDPASPGDGVNDILYFGTVAQSRSTDSGQNFTGLNGMHADTHSWAFVPQSGGAPTKVYCGNDGGIFVATDGINYNALNGGGLQTGLFYNIDSKPDATASVLIGALQDNQVQTTSGAASPAWTGTNGGDGWDAAYDGGIAGQAYCTSGFFFPAPVHSHVPFQRRRRELERDHSMGHSQRRRLQQLPTGPVFSCRATPSRSPSARLPVSSSPTSPETCPRAPSSERRSTRTIRA